MKHILSCFVENKPGVLARIAGLFARRGFNIESLAVGPTEDEHTSRMTITVSGEDAVIEQIMKQLHKLIEVIRVSDITQEPHVEREIALVKVNANAKTRAEILQIVEVFRANVVDISDKTLTVEATGDEDKIIAIETLFKKYGIRELVRTGRIALVRGDKSTEKE